MRISSPAIVAIALGLAACGSAETDHDTLAAIEANQSAEAEEDGRIVCAPNGAADFARICTIDREQAEKGLTLTVRHPDGAFRRLLVTKDGRGVVAADGAEPAVVKVIAADRIEVALGGDRYQLPATVRGGGR